MKTYKVYQGKEVAMVILAEKHTKDERTSLFFVEENIVGSYSCIEPHEVKVCN